MGIGQSFGLVDFKLQFKGLDEIGKGSSDFACSSIVAGQIVVGGRFELQGSPSNKLGFSELIETHLEPLLLQVDHSRQVEIFA